MVHRQLKNDRTGVGCVVLHRPGAYWGFISMLETVAFVISVDHIEVKALGGNMAVSLPFVFRLYAGMYACM